MHGPSAVGRRCLPLPLSFTLRRAPPRPYCFPGLVHPVKEGVQSRLWWWLQLLPPPPPPPPLLLLLAR